MSSFIQISPPAASHADELATLGKQWWLYLVFGIISVLAGFVALGHALIATLASVLFFGVLLLVAGFTELVHSVLVHNLKGFAIHLLSAALYLLAGLFILESPAQAALFLTLFIAASFLVGGLLRVVFSIVRRFHAWPWVLLNGVIDLFLGLMILQGWPASSIWVIGMFIGIDLIFQGWCWIILALSARSISSTPTAPAVPT